MRVILLGGPLHGQIEEVTGWPIKTLARTNISVDKYRSYTDDTLVQTSYSDRKIAFFNKTTVIGLHETIKDNSFLDTLLFSTFIKESYHDLFRNR